MLVYQGRHELTLNRGGEKFSLEHLEREINRTLQLDVLCLAIPHSRLGQDLGILVQSELQEAAASIKHRIKEFLRITVGSQFDLSHFAFTKEFPKNSSIKTDRMEATRILLEPLL